MFMRMLRKKDKKLINFKNGYGVEKTYKIR